MSTVKKELIFLILQFLDEEGFKETAHTLERESGFYFEMNYFEDLVLAGKWDEAESYLSGFTSINDNRHSTKIYFELRKQKFLEALDNNERAKALDILNKDLKVFAPGHEELYKEMTLLLTLNNIREHESLSTYEDANSVRKILVQDIKKVIEANPLFHGKLKIPAIKCHRLRHLINQSLNWQHLLCKDPLPDPIMQTILVDHVCKPCSNHSLAHSADNSSIGRTSTPLSNSSNSSPSTVTDSVPFPNAQTKPETAVEVLGDPNHISKGRPCQASNEVSSDIANDLPKTVVQTLKEDSPPVSMDFHPVWHTALLGTLMGNIGLWDVNSGEKLLSRNFEVWDIGACSTNFKASLGKDFSVSVKRIMWSPDGQLFGVAFSEHIVQLYSYYGGNHISQRLEIDAHDGSVNDLAFSSIHEQLLVITCGDDKTIKVWDAITGDRCYTFEGHDASVYSICPHMKENVHFVFSTSVDGKIKAWLYDTLGARVDFNAPGCGYTKLAYSAGDRRLFSCGTGKDGEPYLVEWDESEGYIKRVYDGLKKPCFSPIHFDTNQNQVLAAGDDHLVKFWDMDNVELWTSIDANGGLLANPCIRFNKEGTLLAVAAKEDKIKILATDSGIFLNRTKVDSVHTPSVLSETLGKHVVTPTSIDGSSGVIDGGMLMNGCNEGLEWGRSNLIEEASSKLRVWNVFDIYKASQCQFLQLPVRAKVNKVVRLTYTNAGNAILALASNGTHLLWKWPQNNLNLDGQATTHVSPHLWQPRSGLQLMSNDLKSANPEDPVSCFALSKNDSYLLSTSGGIISLFNMLTYKTLTTILPPPPMATSLALYPQDNNILAVGLENSSILIYNVRTNKIRRRLEGHSKRVTALAFSKTLNILVSADVNAQIFVWNTNWWEKQKDRYLEIHDRKIPEVLSETYIEFHHDQIHFLAVHHTHFATYEATELKCVNQWVPEVSVVITHATFSSDGQNVYASFADGTLAIFDALNLQMHCRINPTAYLFPTSSLRIYPLAIAAHPHKPTQFAVGLTDGSVYVFEPREPGGEWSRLPFNGKEPVSTM